MVPPEVDGHWVTMIQPVPRHPRQSSISSRDCDGRGGAVIPRSQGGGGRTEAVQENRSREIDGADQLYSHAIHVAAREGRVPRQHLADAIGSPLKRDHGLAVPPLYTSH